MFAVDEKTRHWQKLLGDFTLRLFGLEYPFPFMSTILLSVVLSLLARVL